MTALDQETVQFTLGKPYAPFLELTTLGILPSRLWTNVSDEEFPFLDARDEPSRRRTLQGSRVSHATSSGLIQNVSLVANPNYVLGRPYLNGIRFIFYSGPEDLTNALASGAVESAYDVNHPGALTAPYARVFGVFWNPGENQVYARAEVRKALSLALDRQSIVDTVLGGVRDSDYGPCPARRVGAAGSDS